MTKYRALSLKQPWAALLASGRKTIEIRNWRTPYTGRLLIHAARIPDPRPEAWALVPPDLAEAASLVGGVVGTGILAGCKLYRSLPAFVADQSLHLNQPDWFDPAGLFGFQFRDLQPVPFRQVPGFVRLFHLELEDLDLACSRLASSQGAESSSQTTAPPLPESPWQRFLRLAQPLCSPRPAPGSPNSK